MVLNLGLTYDTEPGDIKKAIGILREIVGSHQGTGEKILTSFDAFNDSALNMSLIYYINKDANIPETKTDINLEILTRFNGEKLDFAYPTQTLFTQAA